MARSWWSSMNPNRGDRVFGERDSLVSSIKNVGEWNLVGGWAYPSEKYEFVSWDYDIPNIWKVIKSSSKPPTRHSLAHLNATCWQYSHFSLNPELSRFDLNRLPIRKWPIPKYISTWDCLNMAFPQTLPFWLVQVWYKNHWPPGKATPPNS